MKAIQVHETGGPEVMRYEEVPIPKLREREALVRLKSIGVNFIDVYQRSGSYTQPLPFVPGNEGAGVVEDVASGVSEVKRGDRVAYSNVLGSYAEFAAAPAWRLVPIPHDVDFPVAAALMLQGMTAHYLSHTTYPLSQKTTALIHAGAGGVGALLVQMAKQKGARVIATVSTDEKAEIARAAGADDVVIYTRENFEDAVKRITEGEGVQVVYDSVGKDTFDRSLNCLAVRGMMVLYGQSSGPVLPIDLRVLNTKGSLFATRPSLHHYTHNRGELLARSGDVFSSFRSGKLRIRIDRSFPLAQAAAAHRRLQSREAVGKILLQPS